jgi:hypothetical protein
MKIDKVIFAVDDNPLYADFWEIQAKLVKKILKAEPVLFHITDEDSDFYSDGNGLVKKINKNNCYGIITSFQSQVIRMYGTKFFPDKVCMTADIDMLMINEKYFIDQIENIHDDDLVIFDSNGYDIERPECQDPSLHCSERYPICYNVAKGKTFDKILNTNRNFDDYVDELQKLRLGWGTDEIYFARCVDNNTHGVTVHKLIREKGEGWSTQHRIERHNFPINFSNDEERKLNSIYGSYSESKLNELYYIDAHCPRPYIDNKKIIDNLVRTVMNNDCEMKKDMYDLGLKYSNDKVTYHRYDLIYTNFLSHLQHEEIKMLEIGLGTYSDDTGYSRNMWKEFFPYSQIYVMDIHHDFEDEIGIVIQGDQSNLQDLEKVGKITGQLDFIIDDGSHHPEHQIKSFDYLFGNNLKNGGLYIIEDIECSYWNPNETVYGYETGYLNIIDFFSRILHEINSEFSGYINKHNISQITFAKNCILIKKQTDLEIELNKKEYRFKSKL